MSSWKDLMFCVKVFIRPLLLVVLRGTELCVRELKKKNLARHLHKRGSTASRMNAVHWDLDLDTT